MPETNTATPLFRLGSIGAKGARHHGLPIDVRFGASCFERIPCRRLCRGPAFDLATEKEPSLAHSHRDHFRFRLWMDNSWIRFRLSIHRGPRFANAVVHSALLQPDCGILLPTASRDRKYHDASRTSRNSFPAEFLVPKNKRIGSKDPILFTSLPVTGRDRLFARITPRPPDPSLP